LTAVQDAGRDLVLPAEGEQAAAVDEVQWLSSRELVAAGGSYATQSVPPSPLAW
jgi:hypothetical protein